MAERHGVRQKSRSPEFSGTQMALRELQEKVSQYLLLKDEDLLPVVLGVVAAQQLAGDPPWLLIVGPSAGAKTETLNLLREVEGTFWLSDLTENTLLSGLETEGKREPSLLKRLKNEVVIFKDFTTVLSMSGDRLRAILAQLREVYDGRISKAWGTGKVETWEGRLGFLAGVTPVIEKHHQVMSVLGPRFLLFRPKQPDRTAVGHRAIQNSST